MKDLSGVDFTKYALSVTIYCSQLSLKPLSFFQHQTYTSHLQYVVTYLQRFEKDLTKSTKKESISQKWLSLNPVLL